jgi:glycosyltransferase involved in cell wall biosynthesis
MHKLKLIIYQKLYISIPLWVEFLLLRVRRFLYKETGGNPLVSIVIATYNRSSILIGRTLPAIFNQTYSNIEVIVVGDCVIDDTVERLNKITDKRLKFINLKKRTIYPTGPLDRWMVAGSVPRNIGVELARGDWIYIISDDDILLPECIEKMVKFSKNKNFESISASYQSYENGIEKVFTASDVEKTLGFYMSGIPAWMYRKYLSFFKWNKFSWKKKWNRPCDYDLQHRMKKAGVKMGYFDDVVAISPMVEGTNMTGSKASIYLEKKLNEA